MPIHPLESQAIARICHDLISPIGAIGNGIELLSLISPATPELDLIAQSAAAAQHKVNFFRIAFDCARPSAVLTGIEFAQTAQNMFEAARLRVTITTPCPDLPRDDARLLFLLMLCAETALPLGGQLKVQSDGAGWLLVAHGRRVALEPVHWGHLEHGANAGESSAARVHFPLARHALEEGPRKFSYETSETSLTLRLS